jgi:hypothetical protein
MAGRQRPQRIAAASRLVVVARVEIETATRKQMIIFEFQALKPGAFNTGFNAF